MSTQRRHSKVWKYCTLVSENVVICNVCQRQMSYHNTSNIRSHLATHIRNPEHNTTLDYVPPLPYQCVPPPPQYKMEPRT